MTSAVVSVVLGNPVVANGLGPIVGSLIDSNGVVQDHQDAVTAADATTAMITFANVATGIYTVSLARVDGSGASVAPAVVTDRFEVPVPTTVTVTVPVSGSVTLA